VVAAALALAAGALPARADAQGQQAISLARFNPAPAGDYFFGVPAPFAGEHLVPHGMLLIDYAHNPLVLVEETPDGDETEGSIVEHMMFLHVNASVGFLERISLNLDVPSAFVQLGEDPGGGGTQYASPDSPQFGDLRLGARVRIWGEQVDPIQLGVGGYVWFPTGPSDDQSFVSDGYVRGMPHALAGGQLGRFIWSFATGPEIRASHEFGSTPQGSMWLWGAGAGVLLGSESEWQVGGEVNILANLTGVEARNTNSEGMIGGKYRFADFMQAGLGLGTGFSPGIGTPDFRLVGTIAYSPPFEGSRDRDGDGIADRDDACPDLPGPPHQDPRRNGCPDRDGDGVVDALDACPEVPGPPNPDPAKNGCPADRDGDGIPDHEDACPDLPGQPNGDRTKHGCPPGHGDRDGDGIQDGVDACPDIPGPPDPEPTKNGCPPDQDGDGVLDPEDACPTVPGVRTGDPATNGCPADRDGDGVLDAEDACPDVKGIRSDDPAKNGCPLVQVTETEVVINEKVQFDLNKATIKSESDPLLDAVAAVLKDHPELTRIEVQGHTDSTGSKWYNTRLSQGRADSVKAALVKRGVDRGRLQTRGFGPTVPIADNKTEDGRSKNRRVQFKILARKK
jgi:outer membrane protein OmpA-like peptidoglycan-associated protein